MHRGYLDQAIAFKREQSRENRTRGRRHTSQQDEWLERQRREQREQSFSTYFNGANEGKAAQDSSAQRRWDRRRDSVGGSDGVEEGAEHKRRGWRRQDREITAKITDHPSSPPLPQSSPSVSPSSSPSLAFSISPSSSPAISPSSSVAGASPTRRRTWSRASAVELRAEDGEVVRLEPRILQWDVEANKGPATARRRVEAELRGEAFDEADEDTAEQKRAPQAGVEGDERAEAEEELQTGEDTSAEVSYSGHAATSDDNPGLSNRSSYSPRRPLTAAVASDATASDAFNSATAPASQRRRGRLPSSDASRSSTPPLRPVLPRSHSSTRVTPLDFSSLFSSPSTSRAASPASAASVPPSKSTATSPPASGAQVSDHKQTSFGRRAMRSDRGQLEAEVTEESGEERKEAEDGETHKRGTAWQISMELTAEEEQQIKQREDKAERERQQALQRREARAGRRAKRSTAPAASVATDTVASASVTAAAGRRSRPRRHTANDTGPFPAPPSAATVAAAAAATAATTTAVAEVVSHSLDDLQRSWDDLDQFLATELASLSSTAATRKHSRLSVTEGAAAVRATTAPVNGDGEDDEDVDAIIDDFLASTSTSISTTSQRASRPTPALPAAVPLPVLPAGNELTLRVFSVLGGRAPSVATAAVRRVECYNDTGSLIHTVPLPASSSSPPLTTTTLSFSFPSRQRLSLVRLFNGAASACGVCDVELLLDGRLVFRGEVAADACESLLFTRDVALIGQLLRTMHGTGADVASREQQQQRPALRYTASVDSEKRVVRVWRDGTEILYRPSNKT